MVARNTCELVKGRLLEIKVAHGYHCIADVQAMTDRIRALVNGVPEPTRLVIAADWRQCPLFGEDVAKSVTAMLMATGNRIERSAILHRADQPTSVLQVFRLIKEAQQSHRRVFHKTDEMYAWLGELLDSAERRRLGEFLHS